MEKYAWTPLTTGANPEDKGPVTLAMLPTVIWVEVTPGAAPPLLIPALAFPQAAIPTVSAVSAAATVANVLRRLRDIGPPLPCHRHHKGPSPQRLGPRGSGEAPDRRHCLTPVSVRLCSL